MIQKRMSLKSDVEVYIKKEAHASIYTSSPITAVNKSIEEIEPRQTHTAGGGGLLNMRMKALRQE